MSTEPGISLRPKRVVAGLDGDGRSMALSCGLPTGLKNMRGVDLAELWRLDGEIDLMLEDGPTRLGVGDSAVIQACLHGWRLVDEKPCTMVAVMVTAQ